MEMNPKTKKAGVLVITIVAIIIIVVGIFAAMILRIRAEPVFPEEHLFVDATYLLKTDETNDTVNITCTLYLTNIWTKESGNIKATAYVIETSDNLAVYKNTVTIGNIAADSTAEIEIPLVLSNNSYKVEILIFENEKLVIKGVITISAQPIYSWDEIAHGAEQEWRILNDTAKFENIRSSSLIKQYD
ncbi:MAG: hypothetical protein V1726_04475 [Methanobacteriota archaeon]